MLWSTAYTEAGNIADGSISMLSLDHASFYKHSLCKITKYLAGCARMVINRKYNEESAECRSSTDWMQIGRRAY